MYRAGMLLQLCEGLLKTPPSSERGMYDETDDSHTILFDDISTPSKTVGASAAKTGNRYSVVDISLTNLRTELRNVFALLKNKPWTKGLSFILENCNLSVRAFLTLLFE